MDNCRKIFEAFSSYTDNRVMLAFRGDITEPMLDSLLLVAEERLVSLGCGKPIRKKAFHILVECMQNIYKHAPFEGQETAQMAKGNGMIIMTASDDGIHIATGNSMAQDQGLELERKLKRLEALDSGHLRNSYKEQLVDGKLSSKGGAGLGFIDIARKSGQRVNYDFTPLGNQKLFFTFNVKVA